MKKTIWKFELDTTDEISVGMPRGSEILTCQEQFDKPCIWALVDPINEIETRDFEVYGTGHPIPDDNKFRIHIGTYQLMNGRLVFHIFEILQKKRDENN